MNKELKEKIATNAANEWCRCFKCDGRVNATGCACEKDNLLTCRNWYNGYRTALLALEDDRILGSLWKSADGDDLPEIDREVIALVAYDFGHYKVVYAHRPNPNGWNGTNIGTGEEEHFEPEIYGKGGWNQPHVLYWLDTKLPYEENKIEKEIEL